MRVAALTSGMLVPSTRFRVRQHIMPLREHGIEVLEYTPPISKYAFCPTNFEKYRLARAAWPALKVAARLPGIVGSWDADLTWLERPLFEGLLTVEPLLRRPLILDVDDAVWLAPPFGHWASRIIAQHSALVIAGNTYLAEWFSQWSHEVYVVPTAVDTEQFCPATASERVRPDRFTIGWTGTSSTLPFLVAIERPLRQFLERHADAELLIVADLQPLFATIAPERISFVAWSPESEARALRQIDVGLMPIPDTDWSRGKCSFKMIQYMACAVPAVVSPVGMNCDILALGQVGLPAANEAAWLAALELLYMERRLASRMGAEGRRIAEAYFSRTVVATQLASIFQHAASL